MKNKAKLISLLLSLIMIITFMPVMVFADEEGLIQYQAEYHGNPEFMVSWNGNAYLWNIDDSSDYIIVHADTGDMRLHFINDADDITIYDSNNEEVGYYVDLEETNAVLYLWGNNWDWEATITFTNVTVDNDVEKIVFEPSSISLYSEDIWNKDYDGASYLSLKKRSIHSHDGETWISEFANGDKLVVYYSNGRTKTFVNKDYYEDDEYEDPSYEWVDGFFCDDEFIYVDMSVDNDNGYWDELKSGNNKVKVKYMCRVAMINVTVETPESRAADAKAKADAEARAKAAVEARAKADAAAKAEAIRQGVYDSSLPKVKASKPTTKKATVTAKWKKLNKKQLKKSKATHYEVWICENSSFAKDITKEKIVKKSKASFKFTGLKKNTKYFVRVRAIKYVNGIKHVGNWSQKTIKTKKK